MARHPRARHRRRTTVTTGRSTNSIILTLGLCVFVIGTLIHLYVFLANQQDVKKPPMKVKTQDEMKVVAVDGSTTDGMLTVDEFQPWIRMNPCNSIDRNENVTGQSYRKCITKAEPSMLTSFGGDRLGNKMLNYAAHFAIGHYNSRPTFMSPSVSDFISKYFKVSMDTLSQKLKASVKWRVVDTNGILNDSFKKLNVTNPYIELNGLPHGWQIFHELRPLILNEFQFYDQILEHTETQLRNIREEFSQNSSLTNTTTNVTFVGIHVRRTDFAGYSPGMEFYKAAMLYFDKRYNNVIFIVAGDDSPWCVENFSKFKNDSRIRVINSFKDDPDGPGFDLSVLSHCDHVIFGVGSFGFWAGYLNPGEVIFCSDCISSSSNYLRNRRIYNGDYGNVVLPTWIGYSEKGVRTNRSDLARTKDLIG